MWIPGGVIYLVAALCLFNVWIVFSDVRKVAVEGTSGSGKSTLGAELARRLGVPYVELDALHHGPDWTEPPIEEFRARVSGAMSASARGWVIDRELRQEARTPGRRRGRHGRLARHASGPGAATALASDDVSRAPPRRVVERQPRNVPRRVSGTRLAVRVDAALARTSPPRVAAHPGQLSRPGAPPLAEVRRWLASVPDASAEDTCSSVGAA